MGQTERFYLAPAFPQRLKPGAFWRCFRHGLSPCPSRSKSKSKSKGKRARVPAPHDQRQDQGRPLFRAMNYRRVAKIEQIGRDSSGTLPAMTTQTIPEYLEEERQKAAETQLRTEEEAARIQPLRHGHHRTSKSSGVEPPASVKAATKKKKKRKTAAAGRKKPRAAVKKAAKIRKKPRAAVKKAAKIRKRA
jgi:hypothetical protein